MNHTTHPATSNNAPAGWYRVDGDPPGTMRRWNGVEWLGVPTMLEASTETIGQQRRPLGRLAVSGVAAAVVSVIGFCLMALTMLALAISFHDGAQQVERNYFATGRIRDVGRIVDGLGDSVAVIILLVLITAVSFTSWVTNAALASNAISGSHLGRRQFGGLGYLLYIVFFILFGVVYLVLLVLWRDSKSKSPRRKRVGLFELVSKTAAACRVGPIKVFVWWVLLWFPAVLGLGTLLWLDFFGRQRPGSMKLAMQIAEVVLVAEVISLAMICATIIVITKRLMAR